MGLLASFAGHPRLAMYYLYQPYTIYIHIPFAEIMMPGLCDTLTISQPSQLTFLFWLGSWFA
jgi:hypothetical protein